jgi:probable rRNA maturation factor
MRAAEPEEPEPDQRLSLEIVTESGDWPDEGALAALARQIAGTVAQAITLPHHACEATLALSSDSNVQRLNRQYREQDKPTNVLSFPAASHHVGPEGDNPGETTLMYLGDIIVARETLAREAEELGRPFTSHFAHLTTHGLLHLLGFDHETDGDAECMERLETEILAEIGIPDPYETREEPAGTPG